MSTHQPPPQTQPPPGPKKENKSPEFVKIVSHSQLFYWWPVWLVGFILGAISFFGGNRMAVLPDDSSINPPVKVQTGDPNAKEKDKKEDKYTYTITVPGVPPDGTVTKGVPVPMDSNESPFKVHMSQNKSLGVVFAVTLLLVIFITNVPLRGMWSVVILVSLVAIAIIIFLLPGTEGRSLWETIIGWLGFLDIRINTGGYFFISTVLLLLWAVTVFLFDQQKYWIFTPGQLRIHEAIGGGETAFDTRGMMTEKHRDDLFRHWILGLGTGDLTVRTSGAQQKEFRIPNVWWVGHKLALIQRMQGEIQVVGGQR